MNNMNEQSEREEINNISDEETDLIAWGTGVFGKMQNEYANRILETIRR